MTKKSETCPDCLRSDTEITDSFLSCRACGYISGATRAAEEQVYWCSCGCGFRIGRPIISKTTLAATRRMELGMGVYWCRECSGEPPQHIKDYRKSAVFRCSDCAGGS